MKFEKSVAAGSALGLTKRIIDACGIRFAGTESCLRAGEILKQELEQACDYTHTEEFEFHPAALLSYVRVFTGSYVVATVLLFFGGPVVYASLLILLFGALYLHFQYNLFAGTFDGLFPKARGHNVYGVIEPAHEAFRQIIIAGHYDSACVFRYFLRRQKLFIFRVFALMSIYLGAVLILLFWSVFRLISGDDPSISRWIAYAMAIGSVAVIPGFFSYMERSGSPGAGDNLISSAVALELARAFSGKKGANRLQHTRLFLLSTDAEEPGLKGSRDFDSRHKEELHQVPTSLINLECLYHLEDLGFMVNDCNGFVKLSAMLAEYCNGIAKEKGYPSRLIKLPLGGGATDSAEFARSGIDATTILGMSTKLIRDGLVYHTPYDTVENIDPGVVEAALDILHTFVLRQDSLDSPANQIT